MQGVFPELASRDKFESAGNLISPRFDTNPMKWGVVAVQIVAIVFCPIITVTKRRDDT
jgi:hypothetical protein